MTSHRRRTGRDWKHDVLPFGEQALCKPFRPNAGKLDPRWSRGCFVGIDLRSGEGLFASEAGILRARGWQRVTADAKWDLEFFAACVGSPWNPAGVPERDTLAAAEVPARTFERQRSMYITKTMLEETGASVGCRGCAAPGAPHSAECRARFDRKYDGKTNFWAQPCRPRTTRRARLRSGIGGLKPRTWHCLRPWRRTRRPRHPLPPASAPPRFPSPTWTWRGTRGTTTCRRLALPPPRPRVIKMLAITYWP